MLGAIKIIKMKTNKSNPIHTERLILREYEKDDWALVHHYAEKTDVVEFLPWGPNTEEETKQFIERVIKNRSKTPREKYEFAVILKENDKLIGGCSLNICNPEDQSGEIGYCFSPEIWGNGYATEAVSALIEFTFQKLEIHRLFAGVEPENTRSIRVLERLGLRLEGHLKENKLIRGKWRDTLIYAILAKEWENT